MTVMNPRPVIKHKGAQDETIIFDEIYLHIIYVHGQNPCTVGDMELFSIG